MKQAHLILALAAGLGLSVTAAAGDKKGADVYKAACAAL